MLMFSVMVIWQAVYWPTDSKESASSTTQVVDVGDRLRTIKVAIDSEKDIQAVTLRVEVSDNLELAGFGNRKEIKWTTNLRQGVNVISLPIVGLAEGRGAITTHIKINGKEKTMRIMTDYKLPGAALSSHSVLNS